MSDFRPEGDPQINLYSRLREKLTAQIGANATKVAAGVEPDEVAIINYRPNEHPFSATLPLVTIGSVVVEKVYFIRGRHVGTATEHQRIAMRVIAHSGGEPVEVPGTWSREYLIACGGECPPTIYPFYFFSTPERYNTAELDALQCQSVLDIIDAAEPFIKEDGGIVGPLG